MLSFPLRNRGVPGGWSNAHSRRNPLDLADMDAHNKTEEISRWY